MLAFAVGCSDGPTTLGTGSSGSGTSSTGSGSGGDVGSGGDDSSNAASNSASSSSTTVASTSSSASGMGGSDFMTYAAPQVGVEDINTSSATYQQTISIDTYPNQVTAWFFGHST